MNKAAYLSLSIIAMIGASSMARADNYLFQIDAISPNLIELSYYKNGGLLRRDDYPQANAVASGFVLQSNATLPFTFDNQFNYYGPHGKFLYDTIHTSGAAGDRLIYFDFSGPAYASISGPLPNGGHYDWNAGWLPAVIAGRVSNNDFYDIQIRSYDRSAIAVPEPSSWAMLMAGFGVVGAVARRRATVRPIVA